MIPFLDLAAAHRELRPEIDRAIAGVLDRGDLVLGREVAAFEAEFAAYTGARECVAVGNGLDALTLTLRAHGIGPGDEVIVPSHTFVATWLAVSLCGAIPVPVEPDPRTRNLCPERVERHITGRTRAICPVHLYGAGADMVAFTELAERHGVLLVQDAAQAHGAWVAGRPPATFGDATWSFYPGKNLGALGDGGAVTTDDPALAETVRLLRNYGSREKYRHDVKGVNSRLDELQAAVLRVKLRHLPVWNAHRARVAAVYDQALADLDLVRPVADDASNRSSWHLYAVELEERDAVQRRLAAAGVQTLIHYPVPPHRQPAYAGEGFAEQPVAERLAARVLSLPMGPHLSIDDACRVADEVGRAVRAS